LLHARAAITLVIAARAISGTCAISAAGIGTDAFASAKG
jgi:hypothetical protein